MAIGGFWCLLKRWFKIVHRFLCLHKMLVQTCTPMGGTVSQFGSKHTSHGVSTKPLLQGSWLKAQRRRMAQGSWLNAHGQGGTGPGGAPGPGSNLNH